MSVAPGSRLSLFAFLTCSRRIFSTYSGSLSLYPGATQSFFGLLVLVNCIVISTAAWSLHLEVDPSLLSSAFSCMVGRTCAAVLILGSLVLLNMHGEAKILSISFLVMCFLFCVSFGFCVVVMRVYAGVVGCKVLKQSFKLPHFAAQACICFTPNGLSCHIPPPVRLLSSFRLTMLFVSANHM